VIKVADARAEAEKSARTLTELIFNRLRVDILRCRLRPGEKLRVDELRLAYGGGGSPVREALSRLSSIGLVRAEGQRGFTVAEVSIPDLLDVTKVRIWVETTALRHAIRKGDRDWEAEILAAAHRLGAPPIGAPALDPQWEKLHRNFHAALVRACGSPRLLSHRELLCDLSDRYRHLSVVTAKSPRDATAEHRAIMEATLARNADVACRLLGEHFMETARIVLADALGLGDAAASMISALQSELL